MSENENKIFPCPTQATCPVCAASDENEMRLLDYVIVLAKRNWLIIGITFSFALITAIYSLFLPNIYQATTTILPPQQGSSSMVGGLSGIAGGAMGIRIPTISYGRSSNPTMPITVSAPVSTHGVLPGARSQPGKEIPPSASSAGLA